VPESLRDTFAPTSAMAIRFLARKYDVIQDVDAEVEQTLRPALEDVRQALGGKQYLLDVFTYADVAIAAALQAVRPHDGASLSPGTRAAWTNDVLARDFDDLLMWRDAVYRKQR
jgi:glutathione S-transferase